MQLRVLNRVVLVESVLPLTLTLGCALAVSLAVLLATLARRAVDSGAGQWSDIGVRPLPPPVRYVLLAIGLLVVAVAGIVLGTVADIHRLSGLGSLAAVVVGLALGLAIALSVRAYFIGVRVPSLARRLRAMGQAIEAGQPVSGRFWAGLRDLGPGPPDAEGGNHAGSDETFPLPGQPPRLARWLSGRIEISPTSVIWVRSITGRARDLTGAECTTERRPDPGYREMTLTVPGSYKGEILKVLGLRAHGSDVEVITQVQQLEILRYSLARTPQVPGGVTSRPSPSADAS